MRASWFFTAKDAATAPKHVPGMSSAVLVTGASTGIGYATAELLAQSGFVVFAGVRKPEDAERLHTVHERIRAVRLDVERSDEIAQTMASIERSNLPLHAIVNNAGVALAGPLEYLPLDEFKRQFEINVFGAVAVTQASLPLLRREKGRIVFISSVSGQIAPPFLGPYAASKFALEALADSLRMELSPFGIAVSVIQPGNVRTPIWRKGREERDLLAARMPAQAMDHYGAAIEGLVRATEHEERTGIDASIVARSVLTAITSPNPRARYAVGNPPAWQRRMAAMLPERVRDRLILRNIADRTRDNPSAE
jgi:NAD(P)-dependent dehydrogenase (short-subunit alcohol dehydrogenase family)